MTRASERFHIDHQRVKQANWFVYESDGLDDRNLKDVRSFVRELGLQVRKLGLLHVLAEQASRKDGRDDVLLELFGWLGRAPSTKGLRLKGDTLSDLLGQLSKCDSRTLAALEAESQCYIGWLKRIVEGRYLVWKREQEKEQTGGE